MRPTVWSPALGLAACFALNGACGDDEGATGGGGTTSSSTSVTSSSTATSSSASSSTSTGQGGGPSLDKSECDGPEDCPGGECVDINGGGYRACRYPVVEATMCTGSDLDECCDSADCAGGAACLPAPLVPFCGGVQPEMYNACGVDQCASNDDCVDGVCVPAGVVGNQVAMCVAAMCYGTVCGRESLSSCALVRDPCCNGPAGFYCIEEDGCQSNADCPGGYCDLGVCMPGAPVCPA